MGHSLWVKKKWRGGAEPSSSPFIAPIKAAIVAGILSQFEEYSRLFPQVTGRTEANLTTPQAFETWQHAFWWACRQTEETFCDFVGLHIFGRSYLCAFAYLLAPKYSGQRSLAYPSVRTRVANLLRAAHSYGIDVPPHYAELFDDEDVPSLDHTGAFRLMLADAALGAVVDSAVDRAKSEVEAGEIVQSSALEVEKISRCLARVVPAEKVKCLADILNAAWQVSEDPTLWDGIPQLRGDNEKKERTLKELVLKNIEVFEFQQALGSTA